MILHSVRIKVVALVGGVLFLFASGLAVWAHLNMRALVDRSQQSVYQNELDHLLITLSQYHTELQYTLQEEAYRDQFQEEALRVIRQHYPVTPDDNVYPFILDKQGRVLLHPRLETGDRSLIERDFIQRMLREPSGSFRYRYLEEDKWLIYAHFAPWDWVVAFSLKQSYMYADLTRFHQAVLPGVIALFLVIGAILQIGLGRFLRPISALTRSASTIAAGELDQPITVSGHDEVAVLARNFESMRAAIRQTVTHLNTQQRQLESEVGERQQAEALALAAEERLRVIIHSVAEALLVTDLAHRVQLFNPSAQLAFPEVAVGRRLSDIFNHDALEMALEPLVQGRQTEITREWSLTGAGGVLHIYSVRSAAIEDPGGQRIGVVTLLHDVTKAKELDRLKSEFLSTAAHELRTPLTAIQGFAELLQEQPDIHLDDRRDYLNIILERCGDLESLIGELLDVSRIESGQMLRLTPERFDLHRLVAETVTSFQRGAPAHRFILHPSREELPVTADRSKIRQVLENLLSNAVKFSSEGGRIEITMEEKEGVAWVSVRDAGMGIPPHKQKHVFEKFYRVDGSDTAPRGLGLGLHIVRNIIRAHDGHLHLESQPGHGSTFSFGLTLTPP